jgi:hypothetical protein
VLGSLFSLSPFILTSFMLLSMPFSSLSLSFLTFVFSSFMLFFASSQAFPKPIIEATFSVPPLIPFS